MSDILNFAAKTKNNSHKAYNKGFCGCIKNKLICRTITYIFAVAKIFFINTYPFYWAGHFIGVNVYIATKETRTIMSHEHEILKYVEPVFNLNPYLHGGVAGGYLTLKKSLYRSVLGF